MGIGNKTIRRVAVPTIIYYQSDHDVVDGWFEDYEYDTADYYKSE